MFLLGYCTLTRSRVGRFTFSSKSNHKQGLAKQYTKRTSTETVEKFSVKQFKIEVFQSVENKPGESSGGGTSPVGAPSPSATPLPSLSSWACVASPHTASQTRTPTLPTTKYRVVLHCIRIGYTWGRFKCSYVTGPVTSISLTLGIERMERKGWDRPNLSH